MRNPAQVPGGQLETQVAYLVGEVRVEEAQ